MHNILIIEDDQTIRESIKDFLTENDYIVTFAEDGAIALNLLNKQLPDLIILDLALPKISGESILKKVKDTNPSLPIIILTAKNKTTDIVKGFSLGADDYISKPFELDELMARIRVKLHPQQDKKLQIDDLILDPVRISVNRAGKEIKLSPHEFKLLQYLMMNKNKVLSRETILNRIWKYNYEVDSRVVDVYIGYLRKKIDNGNEKKLIHSIRGFGYSIKE